MSPFDAAPRSIYEEAWDVVRSLAKTEALSNRDAIESAHG
jgi:hypothetical protein